LFRRNRIPVFIFQPDFDFGIPIAITIAIEKPIRINHDPVFKFQSNPD